MTLHWATRLIFLQNAKSRERGRSETDGNGLWYNGLQSTAKCKAVTNAFAISGGRSHFVVSQIRCLQRDFRKTLLTSCPVGSNLPKTRLCRKFYLNAVSYRPSDALITGVVVS